MTNKIGISQIVKLEPKHRPGIDRLVMLMSKISDTGINGLLGATPIIAFRYPRFPVRISVDTSELSENAIKSLRAAEMSSDEGLDKVLRIAEECAKQYPRLPKTNASVIKIKRS
jgi:hypothetical protein